MGVDEFKWAKIDVKMLFFAILVTFVYVVPL
jgi:hypothetical protein